MEVDRPQRDPLALSVRCAYIYLYTDIMKEDEAWRREIYLSDYPKRGGVFTLLLRFKQLGMKNNEAQNWAQRITAGERIDDEKSPAYTEFLGCVRRAKENTEPYKEYAKQKLEKIYTRIDLICSSSEETLQHFPDVMENVTRLLLEKFREIVITVLDDLNMAVVNCREANKVLQRLWPFVQQESLQTGARIKMRSTKSDTTINLSILLMALSQGMKKCMRETNVIKDRARISLANPLPEIEVVLLQFRRRIKEFLQASQKISKNLPSEFEFW
jgi:hypothetical protein